MELKVETFLDLHYGSAAKNSLELLAESGSSRKYYRFVSEGQPLILTFGDNVEENKTFLYFTEHFSKIIDNLPEVKKVDRKSTRLNFSHVRISYAVFCLKKKKKNKN